MIQPAKFLTPLKYQNIIKLLVFKKKVIIIENNL